MRFPVFPGASTKFREISSNSRSEHQLNSRIFPGAATKFWEISSISRSSNKIPGDFQYFQEWASNKIPDFQEQQLNSGRFPGVADNVSWPVLACWQDRTVGWRPMCRRRRRRCCRGDRQHARRCSARPRPAPAPPTDALSPPPQPCTRRHQQAVSFHSSQFLSRRLKSAIILQ